MANNVMPPDRLRALSALRRGQRDGPPVIGALARMIPEKGLLELLDELAAAPAAWSAARIGAEHEDPYYERRVNERADTRVELLGPVRDLPAFFGSIDVLVVPSTGKEGQPGVIVEALAAGRPVIARRPVWSRDYEGLPVVPYDDDLAAALAELPTAPADPAALAERFGAGQLLGAIERAAHRSAHRRVLPL
jgi:glycosyltransferase involved in cell wall biosynthesis